MSGKLGKRTGVSKNLARYKNRTGFNPDRGYYTTAYSNKPTLDTLKNLSIRYLTKFVEYLFEYEPELIPIITGVDIVPNDEMSLKKWKLFHKTSITKAFTNLFDKVEDKMYNANDRSSRLIAFGGQPIESLIGFLLNNMNKNVNLKDFKTLSPFVGSFLEDGIINNTEDEYVVINGKRMRRMKREQYDFDYIKSFESFVKEE